QFVAVLTRWSNEPLPKDKFGNEDFSGIEKEIKHPAPAASKKGRLRLVRQGPELLFFAGEDDGDFTLLAREEFGAKDLKDVRILASTGWMGTALEVRVTDFSIRAEKLLKSTTGGGGFADVAADEEPPRPFNWRLPALAGAVAAALVLWV